MFVNVVRIVVAVAVAVYVDYWSMKGYWNKLIKDEKQEEEEEKGQEAKSKKTNLFLYVKCTHTH